MPSMRWLLFLLAKCYTGSASIYIYQNGRIENVRRDRQQEGPGQIRQGITDRNIVRGK